MATVKQVIKSMQEETPPNINSGVMYLTIHKLLEKATLLTRIAGLGGTTQGNQYYNDYTKELAKYMLLVSELDSYFHRGGWTNGYGSPKTSVGQSPAAKATDIHELLKSLDDKILNFFTGNPEYVAVESHKYLYNQGYRITNSDSDKKKAIEALKQTI